MLIETLYYIIESYIETHYEILSHYYYHILRGQHCYYRNLVLLKASSYFIQSHISYQSFIS